MPLRSPIATLLSLALCASTVAAEEPISLELILSDPLWMGAAPQQPYWSADGSTVYYEQDREDATFQDLVRLPVADGGAPEIVEGAAWGEIDVARRDVSEARDRVVFERLGDVFVRRVADGTLVQLTRTAARESNPFFLAGDRRVAFQRDDQFFVRDLDSGLEFQAADLQAEDDPDGDDEEESFLERRQHRLFDVVRERQRHEDGREAHDEARRRADPTAPPEPIYLGKEFAIEGSSLSPDARFLAVVTSPASRDEGRKDHMPSFVSHDGYVEVREVRPKVGTADDPDHRLWLIDLAEGEPRELSLDGLPGITDDPLAEIKAEIKAASAEPASESENAEEDGPEEDGAEEDGAEEDEAEEKKEPEARSVEIEQVLWNPSGTHLAVQIHSYDNKDRWTALVEVGSENAGLEPMHHLRLDTWINWSFNELGWLDDDRLWFLSEESGWSQLYVHSVRTGDTRRLTEGDFVVSDPTPSPDRAYLYFTGNPEHPGRYDTYRVSLETRKTEKVSHLGGRTAYELSPDGEHLLLSHSTTVHPTELYLASADGKESPRRLTHTASERFTGIDWVEPEIVEVPSSRHDRAIYSRFYGARATERLRGADGKIPAVVFVHGAGYLQNAHQGFSGYFREFMFHTWLAENGYHVLDMDYRASAGYGVAWRTAIYRQMGTPELEDLQDGVDWLVAHHGVDPERVGVYGGSYGGFMTMMALFKDPDLFAAGAALRPVTDWSHYNHPYTSNILNTPEVDPEAYRRSSPIEFAEGLENPLLICAPMLDDNVFFQDTVLLTQRLIELGNTGFEVALYPVEPHGFRRPSSWLDEYRRIFRLFEEYLTP